MEIGIQFLGMYGKDIHITDILNKETIKIYIEFYYDEEDKNVKVEDEYIQIENYEVTQCFTNDTDLNSNPSLVKVLNYLANTFGVEIDKVY